TTRTPSAATCTACGWRASSTMPPRSSSAAPAPRTCARSPSTRRCSTRSAASACRSSPTSSAATSRRTCRWSTAPERGSRTTGTGPSSPRLWREAEQRVGGDRRGVAHLARADHPLELAAAHPPLAHVLLGVLPDGLPALQPGGEVDVEALAGQAVGVVEHAEQPPVRGPQPGLLRQLDPGLLLAGRRGGRALREAPGTAAHRVAVLLHQVEPVVLHRDDQHEDRK